MRVFVPVIWKPISALQTQGFLSSDIEELEMLNNIGLPGLLLIVVVTIVLFGRGKVSGIMGELGSGLTAFKRGLRDAENQEVQPPEVAPDATETAEASHPERKF